MAATATLKFQQALAKELHQISPQLAALHSCRYRVRNNAELPLTPMHCSHCGTLGISTRAIRTQATRKSKGKKAHSKKAGNVLLSVIRTCPACGYKGKVKNSAEGAKQFPPYRFSTTTPSRHASESTAASLLKAQITPPKIESPVSGTSAAKSSDLMRPKPLASPHVAPSTQSPKTLNPSLPTLSLSSSSRRPKKKSGLQELLARNRDQQRRDEAKAQGVGLSAFLSGL